MIDTRVKLCLAFPIFISDQMYWSNSLVGDFLIDCEIQLHWLRFSDCVFVY